MSLPKNACVMAAVVAAAGSAVAQSQAPVKRAEELIAGLMSTNDAVSTAACESAPQYGPPAVRPLAFTMDSKNSEVSRKAKRALYTMVRHAGRPGAEKEAAALENRLVGVLHSRTPLPTPVRREILWMLSEIGTAPAVRTAAELLADKDLREDARCVLIRLPFPEAIAALKAALSTAEESFRPALADALRARGEKVEGYPSKKLVPTAQTTVVPVQPKK